MRVDGEHAYRKAGMPRSHGQAIKAVADATDRIIVSRCAQEDGIGLLEENYSSKGFGIKAKSCDWGPFVGFAMGHFQYSKFETGEERYKKQINFFKSSGHTGFDNTVKLPDGRTSGVHQMMAAPDVLRLTTNRLKFLIQKNKIGLVRQKPFEDGDFIYAAGPFGRVSFMLKACGGPSDAKWALLHNPRPPSELRELARKNQGTTGVDAEIDWTRWSLVKGMVNLLPEDRNHVDQAKCCVAGDYDLWGVFAAKGSSMAKHGQGRQANLFPGVNPNASQGIKAKVAALQDDVLSRAHERTFKKMVDGKLETFKYKEDPEFGNISPLTFDTMKKINNKISAAGYRGGRMVHHNDDMGNPFRSDVEQALIYFIPGQEAFYDDSGAYYSLIKPFAERYDIPDNPAIWGKRA